MKALRSWRFRAALAACALILGAVLGLRSSAKVESWDWTITGMSPPGNSSYHFSDSVSFGSSHTITMHRTATGIDDSVTVWGKNGYTESGSGPTLVGSQTDAASWTGSGEYYWTSNNLTPSGNVVFGSPQRTVGVWWKSTYKTNVMSQEALVYKHQNGQNAYYSAGIFIIP
jgi:hypothetical protein